MTRASKGAVAPGYEPVRRALDVFLEEDPAFSAQLCVYVRGECVIDLAGGPHLDHTAITGVFSSTKGAAALTLAMLLESGDLALDEVVSTYWPEFAAGGKVGVTVRQLLSHQAGLPGLEAGTTPRLVVDQKTGARLLAAQEPQWHPGSMFGYHALTVGIVMEELVRRITGSTLQALYESRIRSPRSIDFYLGLPDTQDVRYRDVLPAEGGPVEQAPRDSLRDLAFGHEDLCAFSTNNVGIRRSGPAAVGGTGSARGLAELYAAALGYLGCEFVGRDTLAEMSRLQSAGHDVVLDQEMAFGIVFMKPQPRVPFGSYRAFGHDGAGGALAFADPLHDLAFGYIPAPMTLPGGADARAVKLSQIARSCIRPGAR